MQEAIVPTIVKSPVISNKPKTIVDYTTQEARTLYTIKSVFPFDPFPTTITVQPSAISIVHDLFGLSKKVITVTMSDIFSVEVEAGIMFANLRFTQKQASLPVIEVPYFWKNDAFRARRILQGLIIVQNKDLEIPYMRSDEVLSYLEEIGSSHV